jgi:hypothetical protein
MSGKQTYITEFKFGDNFIRWVNLLYHDISSSISNNGYISKHFSLRRGIRQGCPLSAFIFILCAELLSNKIKSNPKVNGLTFGETEFQILQFADDTALILKDTQSLVECMKTLDEFYKVSGLKLNKKKTIVVTLGRGRNDAHTELLLNEIDLKLCDDSFRYLGIYYHKNESIMEYKNYRHRLDKITNLLRMWLQRDLSLKGKITVLKTLALSLLIYPLSMLNAPKWVIDEIDKLFLRFLWGDKPRKVKRLTTELKIMDGGLNMINVDYMARALKATWIHKIFSENNNKWTTIPKLYFNKISFNEICQTRFDERYLPYNLPAFYRQCLIITNELRSAEPESKEEIKHERLWLNTNIRIGMQPVFYKIWKEHNIKTVGDLLNNDNNFKTLEEIQEQYGLPVRPFIEYMSLRLAIPPSWKNKLKELNDISVERTLDKDDIYIKLNEDLVGIGGCSNKDLYWQILQNSNKSVPTSKHYWKNNYDLSDEDMGLIYCIPFQCVRDTKIQSLQYKIINHIYACRLKLYHWRIKPTSKCLYCDESDSLEHHFYLCNQVSIFWTTLEKWWQNICLDCSLNTIKNILLGVYSDDCHQKQLNYIILKGKWYISRTKYRKENVSFFSFLPELKKELIMEEMIQRKNQKLEKFYETWGNVMDLF